MMVTSNDVNVLFLELDNEIKERFKRAYELKSTLYCDGGGKFSHWHIALDVFVLYGNKNDPYASPDFTMPYSELLEGWETFVKLMERDIHDKKFRKEQEDREAKDIRRAQYYDLKKEFEHESTSGAAAYKEPDGIDGYLFSEEYPFPSK